MSVAPHPGGLAPARAPGTWLDALRSAPRQACRMRVARALSVADVQIDGDRPWDPQIHDDRVFGHVLLHGSLGLGESYVEGWWDCERLDELAHRVMRSGTDLALLPSFADGLRRARSWLWNLQSIARAGLVARRHYDLGNDLFRAMLDSRAIYSCGYWRHARTLDEAQEAKLDLIARKLALEPGMRVLDVGCGWGGAARFFAERYGVDVVGVTISREQAQFASELCRGLPVAIELRDYRSIAGHFDRVYSVGMFEHVGWQNYRAYLSAIHDHLDLVFVFLHDTRHVHDHIAGRQVHDLHALRIPARDANALDRDPDHDPLLGDHHQLVVRQDFLQGDDVAGLVAVLQRDDAPLTAPLALA